MHIENVTNGNKNVTVIPRKIVKEEDKANKPKLRVAAYARVSTELDEQQSSYEAQLDYYKNLIEKNEDWEFAGIYSDQGITGTQDKVRPGFTKMINDALDGKIDLILTKSISRFARNTLITIGLVRKLKEKNVEVYFEKENIRTLDGKSEFILTFYSSFAQEESRSISENEKWGKRKLFAEGQYSVAYSTFLGYDRDFKINEEQAEVVRLIYKLFLGGMTYREIGKLLERRGIKTPAGKTFWGADRVRHILLNEKYCGNALLQKCYIADFITHKHVKNNGELNMYLVTDGHEGIVSHEDFNLAQLEVKIRDRERVITKDIFTGKLFCAECGNKYYKCTMVDKAGIHVAYKCDNKSKIRTGDKKCESKYIKIDSVKDKFLTEFNELMLTDRIRANELMDETIRTLGIDVIENLIKEYTEKRDTIEQVEYREIYKEKYQREIEMEEKRLDYLRGQEKMLREVRDSSDKTLSEFIDSLFVLSINKVMIDKEGNVSLIWN